MKWFDNISLPIFALVTLPLALAPFYPEPHLWGKIKMLIDGTLVMPRDILDLFLHAMPLALMFLKIMRVLSLRRRDL